MSCRATLYVRGVMPTWIKTHIKVWFFGIFLYDKVILGSSIEDKGMKSTITADLFFN